jgi:hypothetical protein
MKLFTRVWMAEAYSHRVPIHPHPQTEAVVKWSSPSLLKELLSLSRPHWSAVTQCSRRSHLAPSWSRVTESSSRRNTKDLSSFFELVELSPNLWISRSSLSVSRSIDLWPMRWVRKLRCRSENCRHCHLRRRNFDSCRHVGSGLLHAGGA